jgi:shikimate dehydrogenase
VRVALIGHRIGYSASPKMQEAAFAACGLDWTYELLDVGPTELARALARLRGAEFAGANVTVPHKVAVIEHLDSLEGDAERAGAVNTIRKQGDRLLGSNTDVAGIRSALAAVGLEPLGARVVVLGVGGSARAAAVALEGARLTFVARHPERGRGLPGRVLGWDDPSWPALVRRSDLLLNATPLGRREEMPLRPANLNPRGAVIDLVYVPGDTPLVRRARDFGIPTSSGWLVLLAQGAAAFRTWTGLEPPVEAMRAALQT